MASIAVHTPVKSHSNIFSTRHAGGRAPLTPSPRTRTAGNQSLFTPPSKRDPEWHADKKRYANAPRGSLHDTFASLSLSASKRSVTRSSPTSKSNIAAPIVSPARLDLGLSDWNITGTGQAPTQKKTRSSRPTKSTIRINGDRFIPSRGATSPTATFKAEHTRPGSSRSNSNSSSAVSYNLFSHNTENQILESDPEDYANQKSPKTLEYESSIAQAVGLKLETRILAFKPAPPESSKPIDLRVQYNRPLKSTSSQTRRRIPTAPERVLDAPGILDDYYLNLLDWSSGNQVAIGLERNVYVWNADTGSVSSLLETSPDTYVSSVKWSGDGAFISVGLSTGHIQIWDVEEATKLRTLSSHDTRVGAMSWNKEILSTGSRSGNIFNHDVRIAQHKVADLFSHTSEVCGLEWRADGGQLASGGNDNMVNIWDARQITAPKFSKANHKAAVKALAWCPWQNNLLATGGGTLDRQIHFWNTTTGSRVNSIDAGSQVSALKWSHEYREIVSCHGAPDNQLTVWSYPTLVKNVEIPAHEARVLHACLSPDGQLVATAASDESLKFWKIFEKKAAGSASGSRGSGRDCGKSTMATQSTIR
jgi:cell division cycle protein 20 (cofactor of APC complex)